jgi:hypothetical protein
MIVNTISNSSPPLRGRGLLADDDKKFKIKSCENDAEEYLIILDEIILCFEKQIRKLKEVDWSWGDVQRLAEEVQRDD